MEEKGIVILIERGLTPRCLFLRSTLDFDDFWALSGGFWVVWRLSWYDPLDSRLVSPGIFKWFLFLAWVSIIRPSTPERARFSWFLMVSGGWIESLGLRNTVWELDLNPWDELIWSGFWSFWVVFACFWWFLVVFRGFGIILAVSGASGPLWDSLDSWCAAYVYSPRR